MISFKCPICAHPATATDGEGGAEAECGNCGEILRVPVNEPTSLAKEYTPPVNCPGCGNAIGFWRRQLFFLTGFCANCQRIEAQENERRRVAVGRRVEAITEGRKAELPTSSICLLLLGGAFLLAAGIEAGGMGGGNQLRVYFCAGFGLFFIGLSVHSWPKSGSESPPTKLNSTKQSIAPASQAALVRLVAEVSITCPSCQSTLKAPDGVTGQKGKCPKCGATIVFAE